MPINPQSITVVIPALNEEESLPEVLRVLRSQGMKSIRVVDNGSRDRTSEVARAGGATVIEETKRGYGQACWTGTRHLPDACEWIFFCDADGSDDLTRLPDFLKAAEQVPFVLGNRRASRSGRRNLTPVQNFGNALTTFLLRWGWGTRFHDLGPCRLIRRDVYESLQMNDRGFGWTIEMQAKIAGNRIPFVEIPVAYHPRQGGVSKISGNLQASARAGWIILSTLGKLWISETRTQRLLTGGAAGMLLAGAWLMQPFGHFAVAGTVPLFLVAAAIMGSGFILSWSLRSLSWLWFWVVAIGARLLLFPMFPGDDIWRYLWEGHIQWHGVCPYLFAPIDPVLQPIRTDYWPLINNAEYSAIYPPITQAIFKVLSGLQDSVVVFKTFFILCDLLLCWLLARRFGWVRAALYAWNPLVLYNISGGAHYDILFLLALVLAWFSFEREGGSRSWQKAAFWLGVSIGIKWVSAPLALWLCWRAWREKNRHLALKCGLWAGLPTLLAMGAIGCWIPLPDMAPREFALAARSAELIPKFIALFLPVTEGMNWIFLPPLAAVAGLLILRCRRWTSMAEGFFFSLFVLSPALHAWYFLWMVPFAVVTRNWGTRWVSLSAFVYFILQERTARNTDSDTNPWVLTWWETSLLYGPFLLGFLFSWWTARRGKTFNL